MFLETGLSLLDTGLSLLNNGLDTGLSLFNIKSSFFKITVL